MTARSHTRTMKKRKRKIVTQRWLSARKKGLDRPWQTWIHAQPRS